MDANPRLTEERLMAPDDLPETGLPADGAAAAALPAVCGSRQWLCVLTSVHRPFLFAVLFTLAGLAVIFAPGLPAWFSIPFYIGTAVMLLDTRSRFLDYLRFRRRTFREKLAKELGRSWCGRGVAEAIWPEARIYYRAQGYRYWHIFPDGAPMVFFDLAFIKSVLGIGK